MKEVGIGGEKILLLHHCPGRDGDLRRHAKKCTKEVLSKFLSKDVTLQREKQKHVYELLVGMKTCAKPANR
jgi:hypothetical protein